MRLWLLIVVAHVLVGCASYTSSMKDMREAYRSGAYEKAEKSLEESGLKDQGRNRLLYLLENGSITDRLGRADESRKLWMKADAHADKLLTTSISKEALTLIYNDSAQDYPGEDFEKVAIHSMLALSFLESEDMKSTRVEARRINTKLDEINGRYDSDSKNRYSQDAFALYVSGSVYESLGEWDSAIIDLRTALGVYDSVYAKEFRVNAPKQLVQALYAMLKKRNRTDNIKTLREKYGSTLKAYDDEIAKSKDYGEVLVFHETGTVAPKEAFDFFIPFGRQIIRLSFPTIKPRPQSQTGGITVRVTGKSAIAETELVQNMDEIAAKTLEDRRLRLVLKQGARLLTKGQMTEQAQRNFGPIGGIAANVYSAVTETADTRSWTLLPSAFYATRLRLAPGKHEIEVRYPFGAAKKFQVDVKAQALTLLRSKPG